MEVLIGNQLDVFLEKAGPFLAQDKILHSFIISLCEKYRSSSLPVFRTYLVFEGDVQLAAIQTEPPRSLICSNAKPEAVAALAKYIKTSNSECHGIFSIADITKTFTRELGLTAMPSAGVGFFCAQELIPARPTTGFGRLANVSDSDLIFEWLNEFHAEAVPNDPRMGEDYIRKDISDSIEKKQYFIWQDSGGPVCLTGSKRETESDRWIAPVYTPPALRGKGYASALVAFVTKRILDSGKVAMLNTDLANPTSNSVYQKLGYKWIADFAHDIYTKPANG